MRQVFKIQGSADQPYVVAIEKSGDALHATCSCPAGQVGQYCKHRVALLHGVVDGIVDGDINAIAGWLTGTRLEGLFHEIAALEDQQEALKKKISSVKKQLAREMAGP